MTGSSTFPKTSRRVLSPSWYGSWALTAHKKNYHSTKLKFLVLKWAITEHFKEYLLYQPFLVRTDNNPLTFILTTPNLDATGHWWVGALTKFIFQLEYQKGQDNTVVDVLSWITTCLSPEAMQSVLDGVTLGATLRAEGDDRAIVEGDHDIEKEVHVTTGQVLVKMHVTNWATAQREDPELDAVLHCLEAKKKIDLRTLLGEHASSEEGWILWRNCQNFKVLQDALYLHSMPKGENEESITLHSAKGTPDCHIKWVSLRCRTSRPWPYSILAISMFLVAQNGQTGETNY